MPTVIVAPTVSAIADAVARLRAGELVVLPTETVYGLGADASNPSAVAKIYALKGRPSAHPLIVHIAGAEALATWAANVPPVALALARRFWPGPLTLVLPRAPHVDVGVTGGQDTIALRVPAHLVARQLLDAFGGGIAAPSANRYGRVSPTRAAHVVEEFGDNAPLILDGGECQIGLESTIVAVDGDTVTLLRPGAVSLAQLREVAPQAAQPGHVAVPRVPGSVRAHYAPATPVELVDAEQLLSRLADAAIAERRIAVLARRPASLPRAHVLWIEAPHDPVAYGHDLYARLRSVDHVGVARLLVEQVPDTPPWLAVRDRLARAAAASLPETADGA